VQRVRSREAAGRDRYRTPDTDRVPPASATRAAFILFWVDDTGVVRRTIVPWPAAPYA